jgi:hypothetical protein
MAARGVAVSEPVWESLAVLENASRFQHEWWVDLLLPGEASVARELTVRAAIGSAPAQALALPTGVMIRLEDDEPPGELPPDLRGRVRALADALGRAGVSGTLELLPEPSSPLPQVGVVLECHM